MRNYTENYSRMPGFGDACEPDYDEPAFGRDDAIVNVAAQLVKDDEVAELVMHVANARRFLAWVSLETIIPEAMRADWAALERDAIALDRHINREFAILNGEGS